MKRFLQRQRSGIVGRKQIDVLAYAQGLRYAADLQHGPQARLHATSVRISAKYSDAARVGPRQPEQHAHQRGLARAIRAEQRQQFAGVQYQVEVTQGHDRAIALGEVAGGGNAERLREWIPEWHFG